MKPAFLSDSVWSLFPEEARWSTLDQASREWRRGVAGPEGFWSAAVPYMEAIVFELFGVDHTHDGIIWPRTLSLGSDQALVLEALVSLAALPMDLARDTDVNDLSADEFWAAAGPPCPAGECLYCGFPIEHDPTVELGSQAKVGEVQRPVVHASCRAQFTELQRVCQSFALHAASQDVEACPSEDTTTPAVDLRVEAEVDDKPEQHAEVAAVTAEDVLSIFEGQPVVEPPAPDF